ncbi:MULTISPECIES: nitrate- and nitrite sensing domain-containing protein [unclassified Solwaraspora]|nr:MULTISPECIES: nitrate- and nitrite sensing domain-containing protein [unclassified Solwaraspora]WBC23268.1 nitrate- and nitrite sensing domain-containing protein [Solwaraspora sp. WMMA2080]WJK34648.1 nitrate- and nitrite sensing domain-containing protein [Solwaraspora sp. WMMA2065]
MIPLIAVAALAVPIVIDRAALAGRAADTVRTVQTGGQIGSLAQDLQQERLLAIGYLLDSVDRSRLVLQEAAVTDRVADLRAELGDHLGTELAAAVDAVDDLAEVRSAVRDRTATSDQVMTTYGDLIERLIDGLKLVDSADVATPEGRQIVALDAALRLDAAISAGATHMLLVVGSRDPQSATRYAMSLVAAQENAARFSRFATADQVALYSLVEEALDQRLGSGFTATSQAGAQDGFTVDPTQALAGLSVTTLFPALESLIALGRFVERKIVIDVTVDVTRRQEQILFIAYSVVAGALLVLLAVVALSLYVARSVAQPLARLTSSADRVARIAEAELVRVADDESERPDPVRLDPVEVSATDEIGDLARAFERVQQTAARLVERQVSSRRNVAQMFGHVGRRTQNLVSRQLAIIDRLEREETDPRRLQHLYRLDHVSSRLRRNAGSLVVLSGATGAEEHMAPLPVSDVIRLALGEIEEYTRVDVQAPAGYALQPSVIADLVLLLAELMENGTVFSPPHTRVTVAAGPLDDGLRVSVIDRGLGLSPARLAEENARLTRRERLDLVPTEVLGLFVVGRLARRHAMAVELTATPGGGVTVTVDLGPDLIVPATGAPGRAVATGPTGRPPAVAPTIAPLPGTVPANAVLIGTAPGGPPGDGPSGDRPTAVTPAAPGGPRLERTVARASVRTGVPDGSGAGFDSSAVQRATRSLGTGTPWNAFGTAAAGAGAPAAGSDTTAAGTGTPATGTPAEPARAPDQPAAAPTAEPVGRGPLRQRVPGAQHPVGGGPAALSDAPADPVAARALLEEFEAGVRRAQREVAQDPTVARSDRLTQRVPGASLPDPPPASASPGKGQPWPPDPQQAKESLDEFETGVQRALTEITTTFQHGSKGTNG